MTEEIIIESPSFTWHHFSDPDDPELTVLAAHYSLHELALEDCASLRFPRAKIDDYGTYLFFVLNTLHYKHDDQLILGKLGIFAGADFVVTVSDGDSRTVAHVRSAYNSGKQMKSADVVVHALIDYVCDAFFPIVDAVAEDVTELEAMVYESGDPNITKRGTALRRALVQLRRVAVAHREIVNHLLRSDATIISAPVRPYLRDVYDHVVQIIELIEGNRDLLVTTMEVNLAATAHRTNEIVKVLTMYASILLPLNLVTSFFGMNFQNLPLSNESFGLPLVCVLMLVTTVMTGQFLRSRDW